jgi:peroxiredoxin (alkyl hydroperoxide reductase subunit C)
LEKGDAVFVTQPKIITEMEERIKDESCEKVDSYPAKKKSEV